MANDITLTGPVYETVATFGQRLIGGNGTASMTGLIPTANTFSITCRFNMAAIPANTQVFVGTNGPYLAVNTAGKIFWGDTTNIVSASSYCDGLDHEVEITSGAAGTVLFVDGVSVGSNAAAVVTSSFTTIGFRTYPAVAGTYDFAGKIDEVQFWNFQRHTAGYTAATSPVSNTATGLTAVWHLDGNGLNSVGTVATAVTLALSSTSGGSGSPVTVTVGTNSALTGSQSESVALTSNIAGTFSPTSVTLNATTATATATFTPSATGTATITGTATGTPTLTAGTVTYTVTTANNALLTANVLFSPYNWSLVNNTAKSVNPGAYFKTIFGGTSCTLTFNITGLSAPCKISYRVDGYGPWNIVDAAASVALTIPTATPDYATKPGHFLEVVFKSIGGTDDLWSSTVTGLFLTGINLDTGKVLTKPPAQAINAVFYGDSITMGVYTPSGTENDGALGFAYLAGQLLGAETGVVGYGGTGWTTSGNGGVPSLPSTYNFLSSGVSRVFSPVPDCIVITEGANDGATNVQTPATTVLNGLLAATPATTKIIVFRAFNGSGATGLTAAVAACTTPSRVVYVDTTGYFTTANSSDGLHPYGVENITHIAPAVAKAVRPYIVTASVKPATTKTISVTFQNRSGAAQANVSGLFWEWSDMLGVVIDSGTGASTNATGVFSVATVRTNLAAGGVGYLKVTNSTGTVNTLDLSFEGAVAVS